MSSTEIVVPGTGELVDFTDARSCAQALSGIRQLEQKLRDLKADLTQAIVEECARQGTQTLEVGDGVKAVLGGGKEIVWDIEMLEALVDDCGLPPHRFYELVTEEISYKVNASVAKQLSAANEKYAKVIAEAQTVIEKPRYVSIKRR